MLYNNMAERIEQQEIEEPEQVIQEQRVQPTDHIPLKDQFSSDLSEIDIVEYAQRQEEAQSSQRALEMKPKRKKIIKNYRWKCKWIKVANAVEGSPPLLQRRWVKVKYVPTEQELAAINGYQNINKQVERQNTLEMAQAIIQGQLNSNR